MRNRERYVWLLSTLLASGIDTAWALDVNEPKGIENGILILLFLGVGVWQLFLYGKRRTSIHGSLSLLCGAMLLGWAVSIGNFAWLQADHFKAVLYAALVPVLLIYLQALFPRRWLKGMVDFTWAYVIPYAVIVVVYPKEQLVPILPVMQKFSYLSLATALLAAAQARGEKRPGATLVLLALVLLFAGLMVEGWGAYALGLFTVLQAWLVLRLSDKAEGTRP